MQQALLLARSLSLDWWRGAPALIAHCPQSLATQSLWQSSTRSLSTLLSNTPSPSSQPNSSTPDPITTPSTSAATDPAPLNQPVTTDTNPSSNAALASNAASTSRATTDGEMAYGARQLVRKLRGQEVLHGILHINNTTNNILMALTDMQGNVKISKSAGNLGFRNARKSLPAAAERTAEAVAQGALKMGYGSVVVKMKGMGSNKQLAVQMLHACGLRITELQEVTPVAYNGCRLRKRRRI